MPTSSSTSQPSNALARRGVADQPGLADLERVVVLEALLGLEREHHRRGQPVGELEHLVARVARALADEQRHRAGVVEQRRPPAATASGAGMLRGRWSTKRGSGGALRQLEPADVAGQGEHRDARSCRAALPACSISSGSWSMLVTVRQKTATSANSRSLSTSWKKSLPMLRARHLTADRQHRGVRLLGVVQTVEQVDRAGPDGAHADAEAAGQLRLGAGRERADLLVAYADPLDAVLAADRVGDRVERVADDAPDVVTPYSARASIDQLGDGGHAGSSWSADQGVKRSGSASAQSRAQCPPAARRAARRARAGGTSRRS